MFERLKAAIREFYGRTPPADDRLWHKWDDPLLPVRLVTGEWSFPFGQIWRRRGPDGWEYKQDDETEEEWAARQW